MTTQLFYGLIIIRADGTELGVEIGQLGCVVHHCLVYLQHLELLFVSQLRHQRVGRGVARSVHPVHVGGVLGLLVLVASGETEMTAFASVIRGNPPC